RLLEDRNLLLGALAVERIALAPIKAEQLRPALARNRKIRDKLRQRPAVALLGANIVAHHRLRVAGHKNIAPEGFAREEDPAREIERRVKITFERRFKTRYIDAKLFDQKLRNILCVIRLWR